MKWLINIWRKYIKGAEANKIPIRKCGLFGDKLKSPHNLDEAIEALDYLLLPEDKNNAREWCEDRFVASTHHGIGRWLRNNWGLWTESKLSKWFNQVGIEHADDMSGIILTTYYRKNHNLPIKLSEQIRHYIKYWQDLKGNQDG